MIDITVTVEAYWAIKATLPADTKTWPTSPADQGDVVIWLDPATAKELMAGPNAGRSIRREHTPQPIRTPRPIIARPARAAAAGLSLSRSLAAAAHRAARHRPAPGSRPDPMTILLVFSQHPFAGTSRSRRRAHFIPAAASVGRASPTSPQSGRRVRQQRPVRNPHRLPALQPILGKPSPAKPAAPPNPHRRQTVHRFPAGSFFGGLSDAGSLPGRPLVPGRHPKPFTESGHRLYPVVEKISVFFLGTQERLSPRQPDIGSPAEIDLHRARPSRITAVEGDDRFLAGRRLLGTVAGEREHGPLVRPPIHVAVHHDGE